MMKNFSSDDVNAIFQQAAQEDEKVELNKISVLQTELSRDEVIAIGKESGFSDASTRSAIDVFHSLSNLFINCQERCSNDCPHTA